MSMRISASGLPVVERAGLYPLLNPIFDFTYRDPFNTVRLFDYGGRIRIGSAEFTFSEGDIACIPGGTVYSISTPNPGKHWCVYFRDAPSEITGAIELPDHVQMGMRGLYYRDWIQHIARTHATRKIEGHPDAADLEVRFRLKTLLLSLHNLRGRQAVTVRTRKKFSWDELLAWIDENMHRDISIAMLAVQVHLAPGTLTRKFKQTFNTTLLGYILNRRIDRAKTLLTNTTLTINEIGSSVGIPDPQYFNKQFRKITGASPSRYRDENTDYQVGLSGE